MDKEIFLDSFTSCLNSEGSDENAESGLLIFFDKVKCFSIIVAPLQIATNGS